MKYRIKQAMALWVGASSLLVVCTQVQAQQRPAQPPGQGKNQTAMSQAKDELAPHALMVEATLQSSLVAAKALQAQEKTIPDPAARGAVQHAQMYQKMLNEDLKMAMTHAQELQGAIQKYPNLASTDSYQEMQASLNDLNVSKQMWIANLNKPTYLSNKDQVNSDLDKFQKKLKDSIDKVSNFSKDHLDIESKVT